MNKKKLIKYFNTKFGKFLLFFSTFGFIFILVVNNVGLSLRSKILLDQTLDFSWFTDSVERLLHGFIQGRDFTFTYGPLFQLIYSLPSLVLHVPSYISIAIYPIISFIFIFPLALLIAKYVSKNVFERIAYLLLLFIVLGLLGSDAGIIRILAPLAYSLILFDLFQKKPNLVKYLIVAFLPTFFGFYSYNLFVITFLFSLIFIGINIYKNKKIKKNNLYLLLFIPVVIIFQIIFSIILTHNLDYIYYSLDSVSDYRYLMDLSWTHDRSNIMFLFPVALIFLGVFIVRLKNISRETRDTLLILILSSFIGLISVISRSDVGHLLLAVYPSMITFFTIVFVLSKDNRWLILVAFAFYVLVPSKPTFYNTLAPKNIFKVINVIKEKPSFYNLFSLPDNYYSEQEVKDIAKIVEKNKNHVYVYPYDSFILNIEGSTYNSFALGIYTYSNSPVEENTLIKLKENPPRVIILEVDTKGALNLDDIPNFTRNPLLARWIIKNYAVNKKTPKYLVLSYSPNKKVGLGNQCLVYELTINLAKKESIVEKIINIIKPPVYYLGSIRLPYSPSTKNYLIFENIFTSSGAASLFSNVSLESINANIVGKDGSLNVTRVSAFLSKKETKVFNKNEFFLKCVNLNK